MTSDEESLLLLSLAASAPSQEAESVKPGIKGVVHARTSRFLIGIGLLKGFRVDMITKEKDNDDDNEDTRGQEESLIDERD